MLLLFYSIVFFCFANDMKYFVACLLTDTNIKLKLKSFV